MHGKGEYCAYWISETSKVTTETRRLYADGLKTTFRAPRDRLQRSGRAHFSMKQDVDISVNSTISMALAIAKKDGYNFAAIVWSPMGPVYMPTRSRALADALMALDSTALIFGEKFIRDSRVRTNYLNQTTAASKEIEAYVYMGEMSAEEGALRVNELRNALLDAARLDSSDIGRAAAVLQKATGKTLEQLQAKYADQLFKTEFATLNAAQRDSVFLEIVRAGGRPNPKYTKLAARTRQGRKGRADRQLCVCLLQRGNVGSARTGSRQAECQHRSGHSWRGRRRAGLWSRSANLCWRRRSCWRDRGCTRSRTVVRLAVGVIRPDERCQGRQRG